MRNEDDPYGGEIRAGSALTFDALDIIQKKYRASKMEERFTRSEDALYVSDLGAGKAAERFLGKQLCRLSREPRGGGDG